MNTDIAGKTYWDEAETNRALQGNVFNGHATGLRHFAKRSLHAFFAEAFSGLPAGLSLLEIGCGGSLMLPYFAREFGFKVAGIDYSESGCDLARDICEKNGCAANIFCADFFAAPAELDGAFDVIVSFGVIEHFTDTSAVLKLFKRFLKPGGLIISTVPNLRGPLGAVQKVINREILEKHMLLTPEELRLAHESAGLQVRTCDYHLFANFGVLNPGSSGFLRRMLFQSLRGFTALIWLVESIFGSLPPNRFSSPYIYCVGEYPKPPLEFQNS